MRRPFSTGTKLRRREKYIPNRISFRRSVRLYKNKRWEMHKAKVLCREWDAVRPSTRDKIPKKLRKLYARKVQKESEIFDTSRNDYTGVKRSKE